MEMTLPKRTGDRPAMKLDSRRQITVVGANGSGKTRFIREMISGLSGRAFCISALKALFPIKEDAAEGAMSVTSCYQKAIQSFQFVRPMAETEFEMLLFMLLNDEVRDMFEYKLGLDDSGGQPLPQMPTTKIDKVVRLWKEVFPKNDVKRGNGHIKFTNRLDGEAFNPMKLSHGEKAVFFYIGATLYAPKDSVIFVDSPTMFLHRTITQTLWTAIEGQRPDCTFVYMTHDIEFPTSRTDNQTVWVRGFDLRNMAWDYEVIKPHESLSDQLIIDLIGSRKPVLFVEGDDSHSLDFKLYSLIFPEFTVKPMGSCNKVIETVRSFNDIQSFHHLDSNGIVDRDRRNAKEVEYLRNKKIYVPDVAEIENLMMLEAVVRGVARSRGKDDMQVFLRVKKNLMRLFKADLKQQALLHTRHRVKRTIEVVVDRRFQNINALEEHLDSLGDEIRPRAIYEALCRDFNRYVQESDYRSVLRVYNQKSMLVDSNVAQLCGCAGKDEYIKAIFSILKRDNEIAASMRSAIKQCFDIPIPAMSPKKE